MEWIMNNVIVRKTNEFIIEKILNGELVSQEEIEVQKQQFRIDFLRGGNKRFLKIIKDELKNAPLKVHIDVAGSSKDMGLFVDKLNNVFRQIFANPAILQDPRAQKLLNRILESSGVPLIDFSSFETAQQPALLPSATQQQPVGQPELALTQ